jgi:hypothetical protein
VGRQRVLVGAAAEQEMQKLDHAGLAGAIPAVGICRRAGGVGHEDVEAGMEGQGFEAWIIGAQVPQHLPSS